MPRTLPRYKNMAYRHTVCMLPKSFRPIQPCLTMLGEPLQDYHRIHKFMRILELGKHRRARVWIGELPNVMYTSSETLTQSIVADRKAHRWLKLAAVEVFVPLGPRSMYGLLGGGFEAGTEDNLNVDVNISGENGQTYSNSLAATGDEVRVGLPAEYAKAVITGVEFTKNELNSIVAGKITINGAAYGTIGSCDAVFKHLTVILVKLFNLTNLEPSDDELIKLFPLTFS
jgi:hypothetical protein